MAHPEPGINGLIDTSRALWRDVRISALAHRNAANGWGYAYYFIGVPATLTAAAAGLSVVTDGEPWVSATLAITSALLSGLMTFLHPRDEVVIHRKAAANYVVLGRRLYTLLHVDAQPGVLSFQELRQRYADMEQTWCDLEMRAPHAYPFNYWRARRSVDGAQKEGRVGRLLRRFTGALRRLRHGSGQAQ